MEIITLYEFLSNYSSEIQEYYDIGEWSTIYKNKNGMNIFCLVDDGECKKTLPNHMMSSYRKAGKERRDKMKHRYSYENPLNRIIGFLILEEKKNKYIPREKRIICLELICSSFFSNQKGVGSRLMNFLKEYCKNNDYTDIVLEVANDITCQGMPEEDTEDDSEEDTEEDTEEDSYDTEDYTEDYTEELVSILSHEFWRKTMRKKSMCPKYNIDEKYIQDCIEACFYEYDEDNTEDIDCENVSEDCLYGGYWYNKGKHSRMDLFKFYQKFGFYEEPIVHKEWKCFSNIPLPSMICPL